MATQVNNRTRGTLSVCTVANLGSCLDESDALRIDRMALIARPSDRYRYLTWFQITWACHTGIPLEKQQCTKEQIIAHVRMMFSLQVLKISATIESGAATEAFWAQKLDQAMTKHRWLVVQELVPRKDGERVGDLYRLSMAAVNARILDWAISTPSEVLLGRFRMAYGDRLHRSAERYIEGLVDLPGFPQMPKSPFPGNKRQKRAGYRIKDSSDEALRLYPAMRRAILHRHRQGQARAAIIQSYTLYQIALHISVLLHQALDTAAFGWQRIAEVFYIEDAASTLSRILPLPVRRSGTSSKPTSSWRMNSPGNKPTWTNSRAGHSEGTAPSRRIKPPSGRSPRSSRPAMADARLMLQSSSPSSTPSTRLTPGFSPDLRRR